MNKNLHIRLLNKAYGKSIKNLNKSFFTDKNTGLYLFLEYLKNMRDSMIMVYLESDDKPVSLATIITAIAEFEAYTSCRDQTNKTFHWNNFCELVKQNMEEWLQINDSV